MVVKAFIDAARSASGYSGMAIFQGDQPVFAEHIEPDYAMRLGILYRRLFRTSMADGEYVCAVGAGYTFYVYCDAGLLILLKMSGRFSSRPSLPVTESDFAEPIAETALPSRDGVRREAEALLRQYELLR